MIALGWLATAGAAGGVALTPGIVSIASAVIAGLFSLAATLMSGRRHRHRTQLETALRGELERAANETMKAKLQTGLAEEARRRAEEQLRDARRQLRAARAELRRLTSP